MHAPSSHRRRALAKAALVVAGLGLATSLGCDRAEACDESCPMPAHDHVVPSDDEDVVAQDDEIELERAAPRTSDDAPKIALATLPKKTLPEDPASPVVRGRALVENTRALLPAHVGNGLSCKSCHLAAGTAKDAAPFVGVASRYPQYRARSGKTDTLAERVNDCFERSMNGRALDEESAPMQDILAYMAFLSDGVDGTRVEGGVPKVELARAPDLARGRALYDVKCIACHGQDGAGVVAGETTVFPALWGERSFNIAAGMARQRTAAGFIEAHMPLGQPHTLSKDDAWDLAGLVVSMPRPDFARKHDDWPKGGKPVDAPY